MARLPSELLQARISSSRCIFSSATVAISWLQHTLLLLVEDQESAPVTSAIKERPFLINPLLPRVEHNRKRYHYDLIFVTCYRVNMLAHVPASAMLPVAISEVEVVQNW